MTSLTSTMAEGDKVVSRKVGLLLALSLVLRGGRVCQNSGTGLLGDLCPIRLPICPSVASV